MTEPIIVTYFLFSLSLLNKGELKAHESLKSYNQFVSRWVKEVKTKLFLNWLLKLPWSGQCVMYLLFHSTIRC